jgi:hypothetical protein
MSNESYEYFGMWLGDVDDDLPAGVIRAWTGPDGVQHAEIFNMDLEWKITHRLWRPSDYKIIEIDQPVVAQFIAHVTEMVQDERRRSRKSGR